MMDFRETDAAMAAGRLGALDLLEERPLSAGPARLDARIIGHMRGMLMQESLQRTPARHEAPQPTLR
jgi:hypothetical protein